MSQFPGTISFRPNNTATLFGPTRVPVLPGITLVTSNGYNPLFAGTPLFWLDAADAATTQLTSGNVTTWLDKSGNGRNATQAITSNAPTLVTAGQNGLNTLSFSGTPGSSGTCLNLPNFTTVPFTMFLVCKYDTLSAQSFAYSMVGSGFSPTFRYSGGGTSYTSNAIGIDNGGGGTRYAGLTEAGGPLANTGFNIHNFQLPASSAGTLFMNGVAGCNVDGFTYASGTNYTFPTIGGFAQAPTNSPFNGTMCEMVWYNATLSTDDRQKMEGYLAWKWGLQGQLPAAHPYKTINIYAQPQLVPLIQGRFSMPLSLSLK